MRRPTPLAAVYLPTALLAFSQGLLLATLPLYAGEFGVGYQFVSLAVSAAALGTLLTDVPAGALLVRIGLRPAMVGGSGLVAVSTLALALTDTFPTVVLARLLAGVGTALWALSRHAWLAETVPVGQRGQAIAVFGGINRIGIFAGPVLGGLAADALGLDASFVLSALLAGAALVVSLMLLEVAPRTAPAARGVRWGLVGAALRESGRDLGAAAVAQTLAQMIRAGRYLVIPLYGADVLGLDPGRIGLVMSIGAIVDVSMFFPAGWLMDRFGRKTASVPSFAVMAVGVGLIPLAGDFNGLLLASLVIGLGNGLGSGAMMTLGADLAPPGATGEFLGVWRLIGDLGAVLGPIAVGWVAAAFGLVGGAWVLAAVGVAASLVLAVLVRETRVGAVMESG